jgi:hypothetical protein
MKLSKFISTTLAEIHQGIADAREESGSWIAPSTLDGERVVSEQQVLFDVAIVSSADGSGDVSVLGFGKLGSGISNEKSNRVSFAVPVYFQASRPGGPHA